MPYCSIALLQVPYVHDAYKLFMQGTVTSDVHTYGRLNNIWHHYEQVGETATDVISAVSGVARLQTGCHTEGPSRLEHSAF